jgi:uncharacterized tellurite resistance protein B-like protein
MTNRHVHFGDATRQAALFEAMMLAAMADGRVTRVEVEEIYRRVFERPEFHGIHAADLKQAIAHAAERVAQAHDLMHLLPTLAERLPDKASRELAFGLAASVALADRVADPRELGILKALQNAFDLSEAEVARLFEAATVAGPLPETELTQD